MQVIESLKKLAIRCSSTRRTRCLQLRKFQKDNTAPASSLSKLKLESVFVNRRKQRQASLFLKVLNAQRIRTSKKPAHAHGLRALTSASYRFLRWKSSF